MNEPNEKVQAIFDLTERFSFEERTPIIVESEDWDKQITPAMIAWTERLLRLATGPVPFAVALLIPVLRMIAEAIYMLGYERGKHERKNEGDDLSVFEF